MMALGGMNEDDAAEILEIELTEFRFRSDITIRADQQISMVVLILICSLTKNVKKRFDSSERIWKS